MTGQFVPLPPQVCPWCNDEFHPVIRNQVFCCNGHRVVSERRDAEDLVNPQAAGRCPTPFKRIFSGPQQFAAAEVPEGQRLYKCRCGGFHGSSQAKLTFTDQEKRNHG